MTDRKPYRHRFPLSIIQHALWLSHRFPLSERDVQELLHQRGILVSHETLRQWNIKFAPLLTEELRHREPRGVLDGSWTRCVSSSVGGNTGCGGLSMKPARCWISFCNTHRDTHAAKTFFERLLVNDDVPDVIHTDKLWSYGAAIRALPVLHGVEHLQVISSARCNNLIEQRQAPYGDGQCRSAQDSPTARPGNRSEVSWASRNHDGHRNFWPCMPAFRTFTSTPEPLSPRAIEERIRRRPTWPGNALWTRRSEVQTAAGEIWPARG